jgi:hypothetical protein
VPFLIVELVIETRKPLLELKNGLWGWWGWSSHFGIEFELNSKTLRVM